VGEGNQDTSGAFLILTVLAFGCGFYFLLRKCNQVDGTKHLIERKLSKKVQVCHRLRGQAASESP